VRGDPLQPPFDRKNLKVIWRRLSIKNVQQLRY